MRNLIINFAKWARSKMFVNFFLIVYLHRTKSDTSFF